uniref:glycosyltransferase family 2 protein n=1 Tax=Peristeroidobacter agariperforans TaxID=268404 RepID=UPI0018E5485E|nr:glycosyltransferase family 2 protein [Peristeroidobacter agariperforans]
MTAAMIIFWCAFAWILYVYVGYPIALALISTIYRRPVRSAEHTPRVTIVIAAFNEAAHIAQTIQNKLDLDYPRELLDIIVVSDGSTDGTDDLVKGFASQGVKLIRQEPRQGKTAGLNLALAQATGDIVAFSDANSMYDKAALRRIVANFADPEVGYVTGKMIYTDPDGSVVGDGCSAYMRYENTLRSLETKVGSVVGVDGGVDAVRRSLYQPMRADQLPDFVLPLRVIASGARVVYEPGALLKENTLNRATDEFRMRVRVALRSFWALWDSRKLLLPAPYALFAFQLWSHKVLRYLIFLPMLLVAVTSILLWSYGDIYKLAVIGQVLAYGTVILGVLVPNSQFLQRIGALPSYFVLVNMASGLAFWRFLKGEKQVLWKPRTG